MHSIIFRAIDHWEVGWLCFPVWWKGSMRRMLVYALASFKERIWEPKRRHQQTCHENHCRGREVPGILVYHNSEAIGWCALAPRSRYPALLRSRILQPVDDQQCWSIACLFIKKPFRKIGVSTELLLAATVYAKSQSAELMEGYPVEPKVEQQIPAAFAWTGISKAFISAGFREIVRRSPTRPVMRLELNWMLTPVYENEVLSAKLFQLSWDLNFF